MLVFYPAEQRRVKMIFAIYVSLFFYWISPTHCERLHEQIYSPISATTACFRRLNGTHQAGCSSPMNGAVGVVQMVDDTDDAKWIVTDATAGPYMAIVNTTLFNNVIELFMEKPENIAGVLVFDEMENSNRAMSFSLDSQCPNEYASDQESQCSSNTPGGIVWNKKGSGLLRRDIPFPILFASIEHIGDIEKIQKCYERFNKDKGNQVGNPLCSLEMSSFMYAAVDSELCMRRSISSSFLTATKVCDPLGGYNVYYPLFPRIQKRKSEKENITLVTARVDSASLFDNVSPGASSSVVGLVTLVSTAALLSKLIPDTDANKYDNNVLFTLFNGEAFDYIGSQRVAYDLNKSQWPEYTPLSPEDIKLHVEVGQIGGSLQNQITETPNVKWPMYGFTPNDQLDSGVTEFINQLSIEYNRFEESMIPKFTKNLPPSSIHSFRRILKNVTLAEIVLVDHEEEFTNTYYNSALDEYYQLEYSHRNISSGINGSFVPTDELIRDGLMNETDMQVKISRLASALARTLYKIVVGADYEGNVTVSAHLVDEMLYCYMRNQACSLMQSAHYGNQDLALLSTSPPYMYSGVARYPQNPAVLTGQLIALLTGTDLKANYTTCVEMHKPEYVNYWLQGWNLTGACIQTSMNLSDALSPAFIIEEYDLKSGLYSTWTESVWNKMSARLFVKAGGAGASSALVFGSSSVVFALVFTAWMKKHRDIVYPNESSPPDEATSGILRTVNC